MLYLNTRYLIEYSVAKYSITAASLPTIESRLHSLWTSLLENLELFSFIVFSCMYMSITVDFICGIISHSYMQSCERTNSKTLLMQFVNAGKDRSLAAGRCCVSFCKRSGSWWQTFFTACVDSRWLIDGTKPHGPHWQRLSAPFFSNET